ncbi:MAG: serine hydrolase [bacterium]|nr:serine hydrolase [bacterium]
MLRRFFALVVTALVAFAPALPARALEMPGPLRALRGELHRLVARLPAASAIEVLDLSTGLRVGYNAGESMPAASTIKIPVMVEVFRQMEAGRFDLQRRVTLLASDKDYGSGDLCDEPSGTTYAVEDLLARMIDVSDNTATNMLIRLVGRANINATMRRLGLRHTRLTTDVRTNTWSVRQALRSSPADMVHLLTLMAKRQLVDEWSSNEMISILEQDQINTLLPAALPDDVPIAHKTGSFFDTLNDVGIVYANDAPYVIAVMTTGLPSLSTGRTFIRSLSRMAFAQEQRLASWRSLVGIATFAQSGGIMPPDVRYWQNSASSGIGGGGR